MVRFRYPVTAGPGRAELREKSSRFLAWVEPVANEEQAGLRLAEIVKDHPGASHHCWARRLGEPARERSADAGEPSGTAGFPMLQVLRGAEVSDTLAVVARWFGGTKLGKGGLARAYAAAVREALAQCTLAERFLYETLELTMPYALFGAVQRLVHPPEVVLGSVSYGEVVRCILRVIPPRRADLDECLATLGVEGQSREPPGSGD